jgi:hypothetical protein
MKPTIPDVLDRFLAYHRQYPDWGALHIILEDGNVQDIHIAACLGTATDQGDTEGAALAAILLQMSKTQRLKLPRVVWNIEAAAYPWLKQR